MTTYDPAVGAAESAERMTESAVAAATWAERARAAAEGGDFAGAAYAARQVRARAEHLSLVAATVATQANSAAEAVVAARFQAKQEEAPTSD